MKIDSRISGLIRELPSGRRTDYITDRPESFTSDPTGNSDEAAVDVSGGEFRSVAEQSPRTFDVKTAVDTLNELVQSQKTDVSFSVDEAADATIIRVFKTETGELIKQFPPEEILAMKEKFNQTVGLLYDTKV